MRQLNVLSVWPITAEQAQQIRSVSPSIELYTQSYDKKTIEAHLAHTGAEVLYGLHARFNPNRAPALKWLQLFSAGMDHLAGCPILDSDVIITTTKGAHGRPIAEYVVSLLIALTRRFPEMWALQRDRHWPTNSIELFMGEEIGGKTLGLIGFGSIGQEIGRVARCFDLRVVATKREVSTSVPRDGPAERLYAAEDLRDMLPQCDYVVACLPLTHETRGMISEDHFRRMRRTAYFINVSRGQVVQQPALIRALREGWIAGAAIDVTHPEPLPASAEFYDLGNVVITPHISSATFRTYDRAVDFFCSNLQLYLAGQPLRNIVDRARGY